MTQRKATKSGLAARFKSVFSLFRPDRWSLLAATLGVLTVGAFAPFALAPLALLTLGGLFWLWFHVTRPLAAFKLGFWFGLGLFGAGASWLFSSQYFYGEVPLLGALFGTFLWVVYLSLFPALAGALAKWAAKPFFPVVGLILIYPAAWVVGEWLRGHLFGGYPFLQIGTSHILTWLDGYAPIFGVLGVSWAVALSAALLVWLVVKNAWIGAALLFALLWLIGGSLADIRWVQPQGKPVDLALLQGNIPQDQKWQPEQFYPTLARYTKMTRQHLGADVIVWPETAVPAYFDLVEKGALKSFLGDAAALQKPILLGSIWRDETRTRYYNALINVGERPYQVYKKHHLVPIGEYYPFSSLLRPLFDYWNIPYDQFSPGPFPPQPMKLGAHHVGMAICFETEFGEELRYQLPVASYFITVSNDAWFAHTLEPAQALQSVQMRARELGRPFARVANTGHTALIDANGEITHSIPPYEAEVLRGSLQPVEGMTPFARWGELPLLFLLTLIFGFACAVWYLRRG